MRRLAGAPNAASRATRHGIKSGIRGLTLVEVMVSVAILSVASVLLMGAMARAYSATAQIEARQEVYRFALAKMGEVEAAFRAGKGEESSGGSFRIENRQFQWNLEAIPDEEEPEEAGSDQKKKLPRKHVALVVRWEDGPYSQEHRVETVIAVPEEKSSAR